MKRKIVLLLLLLILSFAVNVSAQGVVEPTGDDLSASKAINIAKKYLLDGSYLSTADLEDCEIASTLMETESNGKIWYVSCFIRNTPPPRYVLEITSSDGVVQSCSSDNFMDIQDQWEKTKGKYHFWSLEDQAFFDAICKVPSEYPRCILPNEDHLKQDSALDKAYGALAEVYGKSEEDLKQYRIASSFVTGPTKANPNAIDEMWIISFWSEKGNEYQVTISATTGTVYLTYSKGADRS